MLAGCTHRPPLLPRSSPPDPRESCTDDRPPPRTLHEAAYCAELEPLRAFLRRPGALVDERDAHGLTPLAVVLTANPSHTFVPHRPPSWREVVATLIEAGADPRLTFSDAGVTGYTPLHNVALTGQLALVELFVEHGAVVDAVDSRGHTPLFDVARCDFRWGGGDDVHVQIVRYLVAHGADPRRRAEGLRPRDVCPDAPGNCPKTCAALRELDGAGPSARR